MQTSTNLRRLAERAREEADILLSGELIDAADTIDELVESLARINKLGANPTTQHGCESRADFRRHMDRMWRLASHALRRIERAEQ